MGKLYSDKFERFVLLHQRSSENYGRPCQFHKFIKTWRVNASRRYAVYIDTSTSHFYRQISGERYHTTLCRCISRTMGAHIGNSKSGSVKTYREISEDVIAIRCDVSKSAEVKELFAKVVEAFGTVDILVNNAAILRRSNFS